MTQSRWIGAGVAFVLLAVVLVALLYQGGEPEPVEPAEIPEAPEPVPAAPAPAPEPEPEAPQPEPEPNAEPNAEPAMPALPEPEIGNLEAARAEYNYSVDDAINEAKDVCIRPWVTQEVGRRVEAVMDAVVRDGELSEISVRGVGAQVPGDVIDCARDAAWNVEWPAFEGTGELRFQRSFAVEPDP